MTVAPVCKPVMEKLNQPKGVEIAAGAFAGAATTEASPRVPALEVSVTIPSVVEKVQVAPEHVAEDTCLSELWHPARSAATTRAPTKGAPESLTPQVLGISDASRRVSASGLSHSEPGITTTGSSFMASPILFKSTQRAHARVRVTHRPFQ
ncbi:MAG: hypothetical protein WA825_13290 [Steroidobacteraceae bacterium]